MGSIATFAVQLRRGRQALGVTQSNLAVLLNTTPARISLWERGKCIPRIEHLPLIANVLKVTLQFYLRGSLVTVQETVGPTAAPEAAPRTPP